MNSNTETVSRCTKSKFDIIQRIREFRDVFGQEEFADLMITAARMVAEDAVNENTERYRERAA